jgi:hypothetical protein
MFLWTFIILFQCGVDVLMDNTTACITKLKCLGAYESTSKMINFDSWVDYQPSKSMLFFYGQLGLAFEFMDFAIVYVVLFWTFRDFTLSLWMYKSFYGNVLDSHGF